MKVMRYLMLLTLVFILTVGAATPAQGVEIIASGTCGDNLTWFLDDSGTFTISGTGNMTDFLDPEDSPWYDYLGSIQTVVLEADVTSIANYAFSNCTNLTNVIIGERVTSIGTSAFANCTALKSITIGAGVAKIGESAFDCCESLTDIYISDLAAWVNISSFGHGSFPTSANALYKKLYLNGQLLTEIVIPEGVSQICDFSFSHCAYLTKVTISDSVTTIGKDAFSHCDGLTEVHLGSNVTDIGEYAFYLSIALETVTIPDSVKNIGAGAFCYCSGLKSAIIGDGVINIGQNAFYVCESLGSVTFGQSVVTIGNSAFADCESLVEVSIPDSVTKIGSYAFIRCSRLKFLRIGSGDKYLSSYIDRYAFRDCASLETVGIADGYITYTSSAFDCDENIKDIYFGGGEMDWWDQSQGKPTAEFIHFNCTEPERHWKTVTTATCIADGYTEETCLCGYSRNQEQTPKLGHDMSQWQITEEPSCAEEGSKTRKCSREGCNYTETEPIPTFSHSYEAVITEPTCTEQGCTTHTCSACGDSYVDDYKDILGHDWDSGTVAIPATYFTEGVRTHDCSRCEETKTSSVPKLAPAKPHKIMNVVNGIRVYWNAVDGAAKYGVWRSDTGKDGTYNLIYSTTEKLFVDTKVESGKTYYYKVTAMNATGVHSDKSEALGITYVSTPDIISRSNIAAGVKLGWNKISGATGYAIYRKSYSGSDAWVRIATISGNSTFTWTDTSVKNNNGTIYKYTIRALAGSNMKPSPAAATQAVPWSACPARC